LTARIPHAQPATATPVATSGSGNAPTPRKSKEQKRAEAAERQAQARIRKEFETRVATLEMQIANLEGRQKELTAELEKPETYEAGGRAVDLNRDLLSVTESLARLTSEWEALTAQDAVA